MATVRVYLCTYRRNHLLPRALDSLLNQTFGDWVCELHNDDPADKFPEELVRRVGDPRVALVNHEVNYGPTRSFNGFFKPISETYFSILEDDNWWEPEFLRKMVTVLDAHPEIQLAWANMRRWIEQADGSWTDTGIDIWDRPPGAGPELFYWPQPQQLMGALHSNGALLARSVGFHYHAVPEDTTFAVMESFRDRTFSYPLLLVPQRLANFAMTRVTARDKAPERWAHALTLLAGTFLSNTPLKGETPARLWSEAWGRGAKTTGVLFLASLAFPECRKLLKHARIRDWAFFLAYNAKHPVTFLRILRLIRTKQHQRAFLTQHTRAWVREARKQGDVAF